MVLQFAYNMHYTIASGQPEVDCMAEPSLSSAPVATVFFDGLFASPRLAHPEGVAVAADGAVWCGTENGQIMRIQPDGSDMECMGQTGGFILGVAFDASGNLYACDFALACIWRLDALTKELTLFGRGPKIPNFPVVDTARNCLYVSDSGGFGKVGPGIWRFDLTSGEGELWCDHAFQFANGMAMHPDGQHLAVVETFGSSVVLVSINANRNAGDVVPLIGGIEGLPDGLAYDTEGTLYISCYEPSRIYRLSTTGELSLFVEDITAHTLCHPTNIAFRGSTMFTANLGRWHISAIETHSFGLPLPYQAKQ
jgi:gluconolactonase